jgi:hypothetical protein
MEKKKKKKKTTTTKKKKGVKDVLHSAFSLKLKQVELEGGEVELPAYPGASHSDITDSTRGVAATSFTHRNPGKSFTELDEDSDDAYEMPTSRVEAVVVAARKPMKSGVAAAANAAAHPPTPPHSGGKKHRQKGTAASAAGKGGGSGAKTTHKMKKKTTHKKKQAAVRVKRSVNAHVAEDTFTM